MFTEAEVRFLSREHATVGLPAMPNIDPETLKINKERSLRTIQRVLEIRAKKLGSAFQRETAAPASAPLNAAELF